MADYIIDIDTQFLNNVKQSEQYLKNAAEQANNLTKQFTKMVNSSGGFSAQMQSVLSGLNKLGGSNNFNFGAGFAKISSEARTAQDQINTVAKNIGVLQDKLAVLKKEVGASQSVAGYMRIIDPKQIQDAGMLKLALDDIKLTMNTAGKLSPMDTWSLKEQTALYKQALNEMQMSDEKFVEKQVAATNKKIREYQRATKAKGDEAKRQAQINRENAENERRTYSGAMDFAKNARSLDELKQAYKYLEAARNKIYPDASGQKQITELNKKMSELRTKMNDITNAKNKFKDLFSGATAGANTLQMAVENAFGIYAIQRFVNQLVTVHGEFEMINKSLEILLHSTARAEVTWERITNLAVKSPFEIKQLATATKQMAAYRIEADKLYGKTKMLADISSGLGVEMQRLILAYGQVKAANFLRGTELRQFSEAGIDMLGQLAAYYSEIEKRSVTAADVFSRISKRQVMFEDVDEVLTRITSQGGTFYKMQEEQAKTLRGQIRNLKDEIALMFNEIGSENHGTMVSLVSMVRTLIQNWRLWMPVLSSTIGLVLTFKTVMLLLTTAQKAWTIAQYAGQTAMKLFKKTTEGTTVAMRRLSATMGANPWMLLAAGIAAATMAAVLFIKTVSKPNKKKVSTISDIFNEEMSVFMKSYDEASRYQEEIDTLKEAYKGLGDEGLRSIDIQEQEANVITKLTSLTNARDAAVAQLTATNSEYADVLSHLNDEEYRSLKIQELGGKTNISTAFGNEDTMRGYIDKANYESTALSSFLTLNDEAFDELLSKIPVEYHKQLKNAKASTNEKEALEILVSVQEQWIKDIESKRLEGGRKAIDAVSDFITKNNFTKVLGVWGATTVTPAAYASAAAVEGYTNIYQAAGDFFNILPTLGDIPEEINNVAAGVDGGEALENYIDSAKEAYIKTWGDITDDLKEGTPGWKEKVQHVINTFTDVLAEYYIDQTQREIIEAAIGNAFGFTWAKEAQLQPWQLRYNAYHADNVLRLPEHLRAEYLSNLPDIRRASETVEEEIKNHDEYIKSLKTIIHQYESAKAAGLTPGDNMYVTEAEYNNAKTFLAIAELDRLFYGTDDKIKDKKDTRYKDILKSIEDVHKAYRDLRKDFGEDISIEGAWEKYGAALETALSKVGMNIDEFREKYGDLSTEESFINALKWLKTKAPDKDALFDIESEIGEYTWEGKVDENKEAMEKLKRDISDMFAGYELSIELDKLHIPKDFAEDFFNIDVLSIDELRKRMRDLRPKFDGLDELEDYQEYLDKIDEMETKAQQERLKKYLDYARKSVGERAKIMLDGFYELQDIEKTFILTDSLALNEGLITDGQKMALEDEKKSIQDLLKMDDSELKTRWGFNDESIANLREYNAELERQGEIVRKESMRRVSDKLMQEDWEAFRGSDTFQTLFNDLEGASGEALSALISHLEKYKDQWDTLPLGQMKQMVKLLQQAKDAQSMLVGPMEGLRNARKQMEESGYLDRGTAEADLFAAEQRIAELDHELAVLAEIERLREEGYAENQILEGLSPEDRVIAMSQTEEKAKELKSEQEAIARSAKQYLDNLKKIPKYYNEIRERANKVKQAVDKTFDGWDSINELFDDGAMTKELAELVRSTADLGFEAFNSVQMYKEAQEEMKNAGDSAELFGYKMNSALGVIGLIVIAIQMIAKVLKFAFEMHDKNLQDQIDAQIERVEELQLAYEQLERAIERAFTAANLGKLTNEASANLNDQIAATERMISLEEDKKKVDEDAIRGWKEEIFDLNNQLDDLKENTFSTLTDGILDDVLDATRGFVDAWHDAYEETGDGMKGLEENFTEMLRNMLRQQASMQLISPFIDKYKSWLSQYVNADNDPTLTVEEAKEWASRVRDTFPEVNELLRGFFEGTRGLLDTGGELSDLEKGIQGMTEDQAEVLAAYWNSCRFMLSNIDTTLSRLASATLSSDSSANPIIAELKAQTELIKSINNMFSSVVETGNSPHSGAYLKVYMP